jgi:hypothetical protein
MFECRGIISGKSRTARERKMSPPFIIADENLQEQLQQADGPVRICAPDGTVLAYASPAKPARLRLEPQVSNEELRRREEKGGGRKLADILRDLEKRA